MSKESANLHGYQIDQVVRARHDKGRVVNIEFSNQNQCSFSLVGKVFTQKSNLVKWNCCILWIDIEKLGLILESKLVQKLSLEKNVFIKSGLLNEI